jgi:hypothetical protein
VSGASLGGLVCSRMVVPVPAWGCWWLDADCLEDEVLSGAVEATIGDLTLQGTVVSGGISAGRSAYRVVGGAGGWGKSVPRWGYRASQGVRRATVIQDAADAVGEVLSAPPETSTGEHYARREGPASQVLHELAPKAWYVGFDGVTYFGARASYGYTGEGLLNRDALASGVVELATEEIADIIPGVQYDGGLAATDVEYSLVGDRLVARIYSGSRSSRRLDAFARLLDALDPQRRYRATYEFRVVSQSGERLNLQPVRASVGMPDLAGVPVRPGLAGTRATVALGSLVLVTFADADPSRPCVIAHDAPDSPGWMPLLVEIGEGPTLGVARQTDPVLAGPYGGTITGASTRIKAGS